MLGQEFGRSSARGLDQHDTARDRGDDAAEADQEPTGVPDAPRRLVRDESRRDDGVDDQEDDAKRGLDGPDDDGDGFLCR